MRKRHPLGRSSALGILSSPLTFSPQVGWLVACLLAWLGLRCLAWHTDSATLLLHLLLLINPPFFLLLLLPPRCPPPPSSFLRDLLPLPPLSFLFEIWPYKRSPADHTSDTSSTTYTLLSTTTTSLSYDSGEKGGHFSGGKGNGQGG